MKAYRVLKSEEEYNAAMERSIDIFDAQPGNPDFEELELLGILIKDYEDRYYQIPVPDPIQAIKDKMLQKGIKNKDLVPLLGSEGHVSAILSGKRKLTLDMARDINNVLGIPAEVLIGGHNRPYEKNSSLSEILRKTSKDFNVMGQNPKS